MDSRGRYETTRRRVGAALFAGSLTGGLELAALHFAFGVAPSLRGFLIDLEYGSVASAVMLMLASPAWAFLHRRNHRTWQVAGLLGVALTLVFWLIAFLVTTAITFVATPGSSWPWSSDLLDDFFRLNLFAAVGGTMGLVVWRVAYQRPTT